MTIHRRRGRRLVDSPEEAVANLERAGRRERAIEAAAIKACEEHFETEHVSVIPPCAAALRDARWWYAALDTAIQEELPKEESHDQ